MIQAIKKRVGGRLRDVVEVRSRRELEQRGYLDFVTKRPHDAIPPDAADLWYLYRLVRTHKPLVILEFGSGCSTIVLAQALFDSAAETEGGGGHLYSLDTVRFWADVTEGSMPEHLAGFYDIRTVPIATVDHEGTTVFQHQDVPELPLDMMYLDGPPLTPEMNVVIDPIILEDRFNPGFVLCVDGRRANTNYLKNHLKRHYKVKRNIILGSTTFYLLPE